MAFPITPVVRPSVLNGTTNGKLPDSILWNTPGISGGPTVRLVQPAARSWRAMSAHALRDGIVLKATSTLDTYRPYEVQERIFRQRYTTTPNGTRARIWLGKRWYLKPGYAAAAVPGSSNHGLAMAVDTGTEKDGDTGTESIDARTLDWLRVYADDYGWSWELQSEPWHLRYFAGDRIPAAVLAYEKKSGAPAPVHEPPKEDDMIDRTCIPSWAKPTDGPDVGTTPDRWPGFRLLCGDTTAPFEALVMAYPGVPLKSGLEKNGWRYGDSFGIPTIFITGLKAKPVDLVEVPGGDVVIFCENGVTLQVASKAA